MPGYGLGYSSLVRRSSGPSGPSYGPLTTSWITATGETDTTILGALNTLESDMATYGLTAKMKALYPFVGGTSAKHKYNFMDARDLDAAFRLVFNGGWTHSSTGALPNGSNGYANTKLIPSSNLTQNNSHISIYNRTNTDGLMVDMGTSQVTASAESILLTRWSNGTLLNHNTVFATRMNPSNTDSRGHYIISRRSSSDMEAYKNGSSISTSSASSASAGNSIFLGAWYDSNQAMPNYYSNREIAFSSIGDGLTDTEAANFYTAVQAFQTTLARNI
jgi:hypothetical protein